MGVGNGFRTFQVIHHFLQFFFTEVFDDFIPVLFQLEIGQLENPRKIEETKRDIARIKTIIRESQLS